MEIRTINEALHAFNRIEDARDRARTTYEERERKLRAARDEVELFLLAQMKEMGLQSFELPGEGVASIKTKRRFGGADWGLVWKFVVENDRPDMLQKRLLDSAVQKYLDETGNLPPGVDTEARLTISVTKRGSR